MKKVARQLKEENIAEYLIYMWQIEDLLRANHCNMDEIRTHILSRISDEDERTAEEEWFEQLCQMMVREGVTESGHLQINKNVLTDLTDLHHELFSSTNFPQYNAAYFKALPFIVELRHKGGEHVDIPELEICFDALYGVLLLRLQSKDISKDTEFAILSISGFLSLLAGYYQKNREFGLDFD